MFVCIHCIAAKTIETVPGHYTSKTASVAIQQQVEPGEGLGVSSLGVGRDGREKFPFAFIIITLPQ